MFMYNRTWPSVVQCDADWNPRGARSKRSSIVGFCLMLMVVGFLAPRPTYSQVLYGSLTGNVADQNGAVVHGVKVEAHNVGTGLSRETTTDENGGYQFSGLQPGTYRLTFTFASFKTLIQENVSVEANSSRRLDAQLQVANVSETVQ